MSSVWYIGSWSGGEGPSAATVDAGWEAARWNTETATTQDDGGTATGEYEIGVWKKWPTFCIQHFERYFLAATKQLYKWYFPSVCPSVRLYMYNWMKWLRLLGGWHFIAATAIKPPKAACQFAADDILLYKFAIISNGFTSPFGKKEKKNCHLYNTIWEKGKEELSPLQYHFKSLHIISRHYKKSLLRSQIYHGYEELSTDTNYPIWRRQKLPYMKKTRKKKQVCGAACFMAAEIKFSEDVRLSVCLSHLFHHVPIIVSSWNFQELLPWSKVMSMQKVKVRGQRSRSQRSRPNLTVSGL